MAQGSGAGRTAPGPGYWELETTHHGVRPLSPFVRDAYLRNFEAGATAIVERYGLPLVGIRGALVNGCFYLRPEGIGQGDGAGRPPPLFLVKLIARLHPELRRRARIAARAWRERRWRAEVDRWFERDRATQLARNLELQRTGPATLDDAGLAAHLGVCLEHFEDGMRRNFDTHGGDLMPVGDLLAHGERWGLDHARVAALLVGSSPATVETARLLRPVAHALAAADRTPSSVDDVRALGPEAAVAVDTWLCQHAWRLVTSDDIDRPTLAELPALQLRALLAATATATATLDADTDAMVEAVDLATVRAGVPEDQWALLDSLVEEARYGNRQREDIRGLCWNWPGGLTRRALLEAGRRLVATGRLHDAEHAAELTPAEADMILRGARVLMPTRSPSAPQAATASRPRRPRAPSAIRRRRPHSTRSRRRWPAPPGR